MEGLAGRPDDGAHAHVAPTPRLSGFIPAGMLDWPGRVSATLFLSGCSLRCPYCHNPSLQRPLPGDVDWQAVLDHLRAKRSWLDGVVVTGGEPTEDPDLPSLLAALADEGMPVKLDTNGSRPDVLRALIAEDLIEYVALDVKANTSCYAAATGREGIAEAVEESIEILASRNVAHEFRTTVYPAAVALDDLPGIAARLRGGTLYALQQFKPAPSAAHAARATKPYEPNDLHHAARLCSVYLPTIVRGI